MSIIFSFKCKFNTTLFNKIIVNAIDFLSFLQFLLPKSYKIEYDLGSLLQTKCCFKETNSIFLIS